MSRHSSAMAGLVPAIHAFAAEYRSQDVDGRNKCGHDGVRAVSRWSAR